MVKHFNVFLIISVSSSLLLGECFGIIQESDVVMT